MFCVFTPLEIPKIVKLPSCFLETALLPIFLTRFSVFCGYFFSVSSVVSFIFFHKKNSRIYVYYITILNVVNIRHRCGSKNYHPSIHSVLILMIYNFLHCFFTDELKVSTLFLLQIPIRSNPTEFLFAYHSS